MNLSPRPLRRRPAGRGFTIIEFLVASALILGVLLGAGFGITSARRSIAASRAKDEAHIKAYSILEVASALGCQKVTDPADPNLTALRQRCADAIGIVDQAGVDAAGDFTTTVTRSAGTIDVTLVSRYLDAGTSSCRATATAVTELLGGPPELLERRVTVTWTVGQTTRSETFSLLETVSSSKYVQSGAVRVNAPAGTPVTLQLPDGSGSLTRIASPCADSPSGGQAVFPSLKPGSYQVVGAAQTLPALVTDTVTELAL